ncbi:MAG TPA: cell envelope integrity protein TolA [Vicinamibacterales bacterium]|nr:cell envelope integrity protein TolA [Vicinamibacterales bacterium]
MNEPASDIIAARARVHAGLTPTLVWSVAGHVAIVAAIWLAPARSSNEPARVVMTVNLGGAAGPRSGGLTPMGGRAVPEPTPEPPKPVPRTPPPPPAPSRSVAALPAKAAPARPARTEPARTAPSVPEPPTDGNTRTDTGAKGQGFGLATGGQGGKGIEVETPNFCCPGYLEQVRIAIERGWERAPGVVGVTIVRFRIQRNGTIDSVSIVQPSGNPLIDAAAARAVSRVPSVQELPREFPDATLALRLRFENR